MLKIFSELDPEVTRTMISSLLIDGTLIDEKLADEMLRVKRFVPALFSTGPTGR